MTLKLSKSEIARVFSGKNITVVIASLPIKNTEEIKLIKDLLKQKNQIRDLLMFTLAINTGLELVELLNLKVKDVKGKRYLSFGKQKCVPLNDEIVELIEQVTKDKKLSEFLFQNQWGNKIDRSGVFYAFKNIYSELGLSRKYSVASWRKTFAYHYYEKYKDISYLMWLFNQNAISSAFKFIDVEENMNLRFREGVCL